MLRDQQAPINKAFGTTFETIFARQARSNGLLAQQNHLTARRMFRGRLQALASNLDFMLVSPRGQVGFFDAKCYVQDFFTFSQLDEHQRELAVLYNDWGVPAGFVVWFRPSGRVVFWSGHEIARAGSGSRFDSEGGRHLGQWSRFDLRTVLG